MVNLNIQDDDNEVIVGAFLLLELCQCILLRDDMEDELDELL